MIKNMNRDQMFRCPYCKKLFRDEECTESPDGLICPNKCEKPFYQPPYESPLDDETYTKKM